MNILFVGKIDEKLLRNFVCSEYRAHETLMEFLRNNYAIKTNDGMSLSTPMRHLGIGSIEAAEIAFFLANKSLPSPLEPSTRTNGTWDVMRYLLDEQNTLADFLRHFDVTFLFNENNNSDGNSTTSNEDDDIGILSSRTAESPFVFTEKWSENLGKCIDGSPVESDG